VNRWPNPGRAPFVPLPPPRGFAAALLPGSAGEFAVLSWATGTGGVAPGLRISSAEREVVRLLATGLSNAEIAGIRRTSARTVANQLASVFRKSGVHSRFELLAGAGRPAAPARQGRARRFGRGGRDEVRPPASRDDPGGSGR
jgi:DNA-binding CsgD family transcriptional regulator